MKLTRQRSGSHIAVAITACIVTAMVVAGGIAVAQPGLITSRDIRNNTVKSVDIRNNTITHRDIRNGAIFLEDLSDEIFIDLSQRFAPPVWGKIGAGSGNPTILSQNTSPDNGGATAVTRLSTGQYVVEFSSEITNCGWLATINDTDASNVGSRMIGVERDSSDSDLDLRVRTFDAAGALADLQTDDAFTLQVLC